MADQLSGVRKSRMGAWIGMGLTAMAVAGCQNAGAQADATQPSTKPAAQGGTMGQTSGVTVLLSGKEEVPPVSTGAAGTGMIRVASDRSVSGKVTYSGVTATAAHIHQAGTGKNGPPIVTLTKASDSTFVVPDGARLTDEQFAQYQAGNLYINIHSDRHPGGELRGQLRPK